MPAGWEGAGFRFVSSLSQRTLNTGGESTPLKETPVSSVELWSLLIGAGVLVLIFRLLIYEAWLFHRARHQLVQRRGTKTVGLEKSKDGGPPNLPEVPPYEQLATIWHEYSTVGCPDYPP